MNSSPTKSLGEVRSFVSRLPARAHPGILLTPLIDVLFLLLVFIMMGSTVLRVPGFPVGLDVPASTEADYQVADKLVITLRPSARGRTNAEADGGHSEIYLFDEVIPDFNRFENRLNDYRQTASSGGRRPVAVLRAEGDVPMADLVRVMDICRRQRIRLLIVTRKVE